MANLKTLKPWSSGVSGNPSGRPLGARSKLSEKFLVALHDDFMVHGPKVVERVRIDHPEVYLKVVASLLPREFHVTNENMFDGVSDERLHEIIDAIRRIRIARDPTGSVERNEKTSGSDKLN